MKPLFIKLLASGFFISYAPAKLTGFKKFTGSGFAGTLLALAMLYILPAWLVSNNLHFAIFLIILLPPSVYLASAAERIFGNKDDPKIVIDEILGYWIATCFISSSLPQLLCAFILFRLLDTLKPWPIHKMETMFEGGLGIIMDDIAGGIEAGLICFILFRLILPLF